MFKKIFQKIIIVLTVMILPAFVFAYHTSKTVGPIKTNPATNITELGRGQTGPSKSAVTLNGELNAKLAVKVGFYVFLKPNNPYTSHSGTGVGVGTGGTTEFHSFTYSCADAIGNPSYHLGQQYGEQQLNGNSNKQIYSATIDTLLFSTDYWYCTYSRDTKGAFQYYGQPVRFKTVAKSSQTKVGGITEKIVGPNKIGDVNTYEASRTSDVEALFSGIVTRMDGEAHAYFRYATLDKPPIFCNDIYGSAQRSAIATRPNPYGIISKGGGEAILRAEIDKAIADKQKVVDAQNKLVEQARLNLMNSQPFLVEKLKGDPKAVAPIIDGYYTRPHETSGIIYITVGARVGGNKFPDFTYSGQVSGKGNVQTPEVLGNTGLELNFYTFPYIENSEWKLTIPNKNSPFYNANNNAYEQAKTNRTKAIADADARIAELQAELDRTLNGISVGASFSTVVRDLSPNTTYYYCAVVSNSAVNPTEIEYGPVKSFRTLPCQKCPQTTITTNNVYNISSNSATLNGAFATIPQVDTYFEYKKESDTEWKQTPRESHAQKSYGKFNALIASLKKATVYQFRAVGEATTVDKTGGGLNTSKIFYGDTISFKTTSGNLFESFGWTEEPTGDNPTGGNNDYEEVDQGPNGGTDGTCDDGIKNGDETGIDKGGRCGRAVVIGDPYIGCEPDCIDIPPLPTCNDGIQNGNETGIDTGGWCGNGTDGDCFDGIKNGNETGIDTGGRCFIPPLPTCYDGIQNANETGIDTGGHCDNKNGNGGNGNGGNVIVIGPGGTVKNNGGTTISSGGTTIISGGTTTTKGGTTTISGGTTSINGQNTSINNGIATNTGGTATTNGGTTTLRGGTTTITFKDANGATQTFITNSEVKISRNGDTSVVTFKNANGNTQTVVIKDGDGQVVNVGGVSTTENGNTVLTDGNTNVLDNRSGPKLGDRLTPPNDAIVRYHEGIETVFTRQIMRNLSFARLYGYDDSMDLQKFADTLSHTFAKEYFGYIDATGLEVRVSKPDVSAYELRQVGGVLTVYEYYENVIVDIRNTTTIFKNKNPYEYYDRRRR